MAPVPHANRPARQALRERGYREATRTTRMRLGPPVEWEQPAIFKLLQQGGRIAPEEMARTFNCGVGMAVIVEAGVAEDVASALDGAIEIGRVESGPRGCTVSGGAGTWNSDRGWSATHHA